MAPACQLCGSVVEWLKKVTMAPDCLSVCGKLSPRLCLDARYSRFSMYVTGAFQPAILVLEVRGSEYE